MSKRYIVYDNECFVKMTASGKNNAYRQFMKITKQPIEFRRNAIVKEYYNRDCWFDFPLRNFRTGEFTCFP